MPISKNFQTMRADPLKAPLRKVYSKRGQLKIKPEKVKVLLEHCAPHLALNLYDLAPIKFSKPLPRSTQMIEKGIDVSDPEQVMNAMSPEGSTTFPTETAAEKPNLLSSKTTKPSAIKKTSSPQQGHRTPEWLEMKIKTC